MHELIHTKVAPPVWMGNQLRRDMLLERLDGALTRRLTVIHAPAGYGKTSLLSQWRRRADPQTTLVAWLTLERDDADPARLAQYLALALDGMDQGATPRDEADRGLADLPARAALSAIISRLAREPRAVALILDDLHRAEGEASIDFLKSLIRLAPQNVHVIIASRDHPWLDQSILAAENQLLELTLEDLKFSEPEAQALLARAHPAEISGEDVRSIVERTEGWPIAVQLTSLSLKPGTDHAHLLAHLSAPSSELARYLTDQVLMTLPEETQDIIMRTALVDRVTGDLINLLCDRSDGWALLDRLEQQGVLLTPVTPERKAYRYHQLFAEHLRERLARHDSARFHDVHRRAAIWHGEHGDVLEAVNHAILADDDEMLATIIEGFGGWRLIPQGLQAMIERGLEKLPKALVHARPRLLLAHVYLAIKCGRLGLARADYDQFVAQAKAKSLSAEEWSEIRVVGDVLSEYENVPMSLDDLLEREALLRTLPSHDHLILADINESLGHKYYEGGWLERALEPTLTAREHYQVLGSLYSDLFTRFHEARIRQAQGRAKDAWAILEQAREEIEANYGARSDLAANCAAFQAELLYERDRAEEAAALLDWALPHMEQSDGWVDVYAAAYFTAARTAAARDGMDEARAILQRARRVATMRRLRQLELLSLLCELDLLIDGDTDAAAAMAAEIGLDAMADEMARESPLYRPVASAAALCRIKLRLIAQDNGAALAELRAIRTWASRHGAGRLLVTVNILTAHGQRQAGEAAQALATFDEAVAMAMFQETVRPFLDARAFVHELVEERLADETGDMDRFRAQFLKTLSRSLSSRPATPGVPALFNSAEAAILDHLSYGYSNKEIARLIGMSPDTVKYRLKSVFRKLGVNKRRDAVRVSRERHIGLREDAEGE